MKNQKITANRVVLTSFLVDIIDVSLNLTVSILTGSVVLLAVALQSVSDLLSSGLLLVGVKRSKRPADKLHPFGYGRELFFWTLISGIIMFGVSATASIYFGISRLLAPEAINKPILALGITAIGFITNSYAFTLSYRRLIGKKNVRGILSIFTHSSIIETKAALVKDLVGTLAALFGFVSIAIYILSGNPVFDGLGAVVIGLMLMLFAYSLILNIKELIIGISASPETETKIKKAVKSIPEVTRVMDLRTIFVGPRKILVDLEVNLKNDLTTDDIEKITDKIQNKVKRIAPNVTDTQVELESPKEIKKE